MKIEAGKTYKTRDGRKAGPLKPTGNDHCLRGPIEGDDFGYRIWFAENGLHFFEVDSFDLIGPWEQLPSGPVRRVEKSEIVPGVYGRIMVDKVLSDDSLVYVAFTGKVGGGDSDWTLLEAKELRSIANTLNAIAEVLEQDEKKG